MGARALNLKVGLFVITSVVIFFIFVFVLGGEQNFFKKTYKIQTSFTNVAGLAEGAAVRLSGLKIGSVKEIQFPEEPDKDFIVVVMEVREEGIKRIGPDAVATIRTEGLLGDKYIEILRGSKEPPKEIPETLQISSYTPPEFQKLLGQSEELIDNIIDISKSLDKIVKAFGKEENIENISRTIASIRRSVEAIESRPGLLHTLIYGRRDKSGKDLENTLDKLDETLTTLNVLLKDIKNEEGVLTALIYDEKLKEKLDSALTNIDEVTTEINSEDGILPQLKETVSNFREISERLEGGEGTLGALINDPTVYDNLKGVLGEAERSRFVRAAVQYLIENQRKDTNQTQ
ncbi:MAG TPA: MlaD family protein [Thermodesulfobacteriota bacterium]|nr:MlaD family protein [Thermodesulfobacteriota bacterium]